MRWCDLEIAFGRSRSALSELFLDTLEHAYEILKKYQNHFRSGLVVERAELYARKIFQKGSPLERCIGFIDGTGARISRPVMCQELCYIGHKKCHMLKYQSVVGPDVWFLHAFGPVSGRRHDLTLYLQSDMDTLLEDTMSINGEQYYLYGDPAYVLRPWLQKGFTGANLTPEQREFNSSMSPLRESVELGNKDIKQYFSANDYVRQMRALKTPAGLVNLVSCGLSNIRCFLYGSQTGNYFRCKAPTLDEYLARFEDTSEQD